ncbi:MAG: DNA mismatch repair protein MutS [Oscillospiraceae bacterium]|jgi:DNA mismatch repair protein MutS|nr:DNA mismatch repair protein MutS [Oscillospiraceae bacterium]
MNKENLTPMLRHYVEIKEKYKEYVVFYRLGDFYEMFFDDAVEVSKKLELTLTSRAETPMCGIPHHAAENYIKRLVEGGHKVAICEQIGDVTGKGLVRREVTRIVTAGTLIEENMLDAGTNNFIACFFMKDRACGVVFADLSTGEMSAFEKSGKNLEDELIAEIARFMPVEVLFNMDFMSLLKTANFIKTKIPGCVGETLDNCEYNAEILKNHSFIPAEIVTENPLASGAIAALLGYIKKTHLNDTPRFTTLNMHTDSAFLDLGLTARRNLELTETLRGKDKRGSLMWVLDRTRTSMGKRRLKQFIERPLTDHARILRRLAAVDELVKSVVGLGDLRGALDGVYDIERLMTRIVYNKATPRDVYAFGATCEKIPELKCILAQFQSPLLQKLNERTSALPEVAALVENAIKPEPPAVTKDGAYIKDGYNTELDHLRLITKDNKKILAALEERERQATGIRNLKVGYNRVFGYYIEISKSNINSAPAHYIRKQTLTNGERYITDELKKIENEILGANDKIIALEAEIFTEVIEFIKTKLEDAQKTAKAVSILDVLGGFAACAIENNYVRPEISTESVIEIKDGRHPVVEKVLKERIFTPNDVYLDTSKNRLIIITGPNMAGKSTFMRQVALITIMAQIGSFVPAKSARIGVVDKVFTRVGASDDLTAGQSTFMVEMTEVAEILKNATKKSLVILDEIGRGTSTFDGISIAKAVAEYINNKTGCKTLFATHYHELIALEQRNTGIRNFSAAASKRGDELHFLHKIVEGGVDDSYGIEVAKLAGVPEKVINSAKDSLKVMELNSKIELEAELRERESEAQIDFTSLARESVINRLKTLDTNALTPLEALQILSELKKEL